MYTVSSTILICTLSYVRMCGKVAMDTYDWTVIFFDDFMLVLISFPCELLVLVASFNIQEVSQLPG